MISDIRVTLLGSNPIALEGLDRVLREQGFRITALVSDPDDVAQAVALHPNDCNLVVVDGLATPDRTLTQDLLEASPAARIVILADQFDFDVMARNFDQGAYGYIVKRIASTSLIKLLNLVADGEKVMPSNLAETLRHHIGQSEPVGSTASIQAAGLSTREVQILTCLVSGNPNKIISRELGISEATVKVHVKAILRKIGVQNRTQAAIWALGERGNAPTADGHPSHHARQLIQQRIGQQLQ